MRLKSMDGPLAVHHTNGNRNLLNSPKRLNTLQNSNVTTTAVDISTADHCDNDALVTLNTAECIINNINGGRWSEGELTLTDGRLLIDNINSSSTLAVCSASDCGTPSPSAEDDSLLLELEEAHSSSEDDDEEVEEEEEEEEDLEAFLSDSDSDDGNVQQLSSPLPRGIINPNYPGFQHLAHSLHFEECDSDANAANNNNNNNYSSVLPDGIESVNRLDSVENIQKVFYDKPVQVLNITCEQRENAACANIVGDFGEEVEREFGRISRCLHVAYEDQLVEAADEKLVIANDSATRYNIDLKDAGEEQGLGVAVVQPEPLVQEAVSVMAKTTAEEMKRKMNVRHADSNRQLPMEASHAKDPDHEQDNGGVEKFCKEDASKDDKEKDEDSAVPRKKEKVDVKKRPQVASLTNAARRSGRDNLNRRSLPITTRDHTKHKKSSTELLGGFDVYNIETAMPKIDLEVIESHLRAAREEERRRRTDREEIRRRLAMGNEEEYYNGCDRPGRKPSLQARLQSGMNLQICFMNETISDTESPSSDSECTLGKPKVKLGTEKVAVRPATLALTQSQPNSLPSSATMTESDFFAKQARLQTEARMALAQAKEMARMQMEIERQRMKKSPITEMVRNSMEKVGIPFPEDRRRLSRQILTEMNVAQLQVIVNDLHTQIEVLNEDLVKFLMARDDLHMEQDSMLVDIEDLTRFLGAKEQSIKEHSMPSNNNSTPPSPAPSSPLSAINNSVRPHFHRIASLVKK